MVVGKEGIVVVLFNSVLRFTGVWSGIERRGVGELGREEEKREGKDGAGVEGGVCS